jgi:hypothetical protein
MGAAYFIVLERPIEGIDSGMDGKSLSRHMELLDEAARELGVRPLSEFFSVNPDQLEEFLEEGMGDIKPPPLQQFTAEEGLKTIRALKAHPAASKPDIANDLQTCESILTAADLKGVGWHFEVDF